MPPEDIPEDRFISMPCECGGNIAKNESTNNWECDNCQFKMPNKDEKDKN